MGKGPALTSILVFLSPKRLLRTFFAFLWAEAWQKICQVSPRLLFHVFGLDPDHGVSGALFAFKGAFGVKT